MMSSFINGMFYLPNKISMIGSESIWFVLGISLCIYMTFKCINIILDFIERSFSKIENLYSSGASLLKSKKI